MLKKLVLIIFIANFFFLFAQPITDAGVTDIFRPLEVENKRVTFAPSVEITNFSEEPKDIPVRAEIWKLSNPPALVYSDERVIENVSPNQSITVVFANWYPDDHGAYFFKAKTMLEGDEVSENDEQFRNFEVRAPSLTLISPKRDTIFTTNYITFVWHKVEGATSYRVQIALDSQFNLLRVNITTSDTFYTRGLLVGRYYWRVRVETPGTPDDWSEIRKFNIIFGTGWLRIMDVPQFTKPVGSGAGLCFLNNKIYTLVGNSTRELMIYDIENDNWIEIETIPPSIRSRTYKTVKKGAAICTDGRYIYVIKGGNTKEFWRYDPENGSWYELDTLPFPKGVKGASMAYDGDSFIYIISGSNDNRWTKFNRYTQTYSPCSPLFLPNEKWRIGSWIVYVPEDTAIYALRVGTSSRNEFWRIPINGVPERRESMPILGPEGVKKLAKDGGCAVYNPDDGFIYALKGGGSKDFFYYDPRANRWYGIDTTPKKIKAGGAIAYSNSPVMKGFYILIGGRRNEFWLYRPTLLTLMNTKPLEDKHIQGEIKDAKGFTLQINKTKDYIKILYTLPTPTKAVLKVYDAVGNLVYKTWSNQGYFVIDTKEFSPGLYIMRFQAGKYKTTRKLIIY